VIELNKTKMATELTIILLLLVTLSTQAGGEMVVNEYPALKTGDYFKFHLTADNWIDAMGENIGGEDYKNAEDVDISKIEYRITGEEIITWDGTDYPCVIMMFSWDMSFTLNFEEGSTDFDDDKVSIEYHIESKDWMIKTNQTTVKEESTFIMKMRFSMDGEDHVYHAESFEKVSYSEIGESLRFPLKAGNTWSEAETYVSNETEKSRMDDDDWEIEYHEEETIETTEYEVTGENAVTVIAGTFNCLKVKEQTHGESEYIITYYDRNGIPVKGIFYDGDGTINMTIELKEYKMANEVKGGEGVEQDEVGFVSGFDLLISTLGIIVVTGWWHKRKD